MFNLGQTSTGGGFGAAPAPAAPKTVGFGGLGANTTTTGGFGTNTTGVTTGGFGTNTTGVTTGGFGTNTTGATTGGFGTNTTGVTTGGFGTNTTGVTTGGFGTNTTGATPGGFGTNTTGATPGGFGTNTTGATPGGFGGGFGGTSSLGFGGMNANKGFGTAPTVGAQSQVPPYKGIKGPGFSMDWSRSVNFSSLRDDLLFEELPPPLQQHLMELHNFIQAEHEAKRFVEGVLTDSTGQNNTSLPSYRDLQKKLRQLTSGENSVDAIRVDCFEREVHAQHLSTILEKCEEEVAQYSKYVWEPLAEQDFTQRRNANRSEPPSEPFQQCLRDIQARMEEVSLAIEELEIAVLPNGQRQKRVTITDNSILNTMSDSSSSAALSSLYTTKLEPLETSQGLGTTASTHPILQLNNTLSNELTTLFNLAAWTSQLHARANAARDLFAQLYGPSEAGVLMAQQDLKSPTGPKRPFPLHSTTKSSFSDTNYDTIGDIHRRSIGLDRLGALGTGERKMQYDVLLERQKQSTTTAPVATTTNTNTTGVSVSAPFGATTTNSAAPSTGFSLTSASTIGTGGATLFGASLNTADSTKNLQKKGRS